MEKYCILIAVSLFFNTVYGAAVWETGAYTPSEWKPSSNNLLTKEGADVFEDKLSLYKENGKAMQGVAGLTDGSVPNADDGKNVDYAKVVGITSGSVAWKLNKASDIYDIKIFSRWASGTRDGIAVDSVEVSSDGTEWKTFDSVVYGKSNDNSAGALFARLHDDKGFALATKISYVKINFSNNQDHNGTGYVEIEVCGWASGLPYAELSKTEITEYTADLSVSVKSTCETENVDLYFAYGADGPELVPQRIATGLNEGATYPIRLRDLNHNTTYYYFAYVSAGGNIISEPIKGSFKTAFDPCRYLPKDYIQVEYLQTSGEQCLNTEVKASATISAVMDFMPIARTGDAYLGAGDNENADWRLFFPPGSSYKTTFDIGNQRIGLTAGNDIYEKRRYTVSVGNAYLKVVDENGDAVTDLSLDEQVDGGVISETDIYLAAKGSNSGTAGYNGLSKLCIYSLVIKDGEEVVRDFVPCSNTVDKVYGLYDVQNKKFYQFVGKELESLAAGLEVPFIKKITEPGFKIIVR